MAPRMENRRRLYIVLSHDGSWRTAKPRYPSPRGGQLHAHAPRSQPSPTLHTEQGPMAELIAEETITALHRSGQRVEVKAGVGRPYPIGDSEWACPVSLSGLQERLHDVHGASSLQALCLAASLLRQLLTQFVQDGGELRHRDGRDAFDISACFSGIGGPDASA